MQKAVYPPKKQKSNNNQCKNMLHMQNAAHKQAHKHILMPAASPSPSSQSSCGKSSTELQSEFSACIGPTFLITFLNWPGDKMTPSAVNTSSIHHGDSSRVQTDWAITRRQVLYRFPFTDLLKGQNEINRPEQVKSLEINLCQLKVPTSALYHSLLHSLLLAETSACSLCSSDSFSHFSLLLLRPLSSVYG